MEHVEGNIATTAEIVDGMFRTEHTRAVLTGKNAAGEWTALRARTEVIDFLTALGLVKDRQLTATGRGAYDLLFPTS